MLPSRSWSSTTRSSMRCARKNFTRRSSTWSSTASRNACCCAISRCIPGGRSCCTSTSSASSETQKVHMRIPLHFTGQEESPAFKLGGGLISHIMSDVDVACLPKDLPEFIEVNLSGSGGAPNRTRARPQDAGRRNARTEGQGKSGGRRRDNAWRAGGGGGGNRHAGGFGRSSRNCAEGAGGCTGCGACRRAARRARKARKKRAATRRSNRHARRGAPDALMRPAQSGPLPLRQRAFLFTDDRRIRSAPRHPADRRARQRRSRVRGHPPQRRLLAGRCSRASRGSPLFERTQVPWRCRSHAHWPATISGC